MSTLKTSFQVLEKYSAFFTGGQIQLSSNGATLFCSCGQEIKIVDVQTGRVQATIGTDEGEEISKFIVTKDDEFLILATQNQLFRQWKWKDKKLVKTWRSVHNAPVSSLAIDPTVTLLASGSADSTIKIWDIIRGYFTHNFKGHNGVVRLTCFHPSPERLQLVSAAEDYTVRVWDLKTSSCIVSSQCHTSLVTSVSFSSNGDIMYSSGKDNVVCPWKTDNWSVFKTIPVFETIVSVFVPSEFPSLVEDDGAPKFITVSVAGEVRVVNAINGKREYSNLCRLSDTLDKEEEYITQALYCPAMNKIVMTTFDHNILLLSPEFTIEKQLCGHLDEVLSAWFMGNEDSHIAVATNTDLVKVFNRSTWECQMLEGHSDIITSLDVRGDYVISGSKDSTIRVWKLSADVGFVTCIASGQGHTQSVLAVSFSHSSSCPEFMLSGGEDMTLKLWKFPAESEDTPVSTLRVHATEHAHDKDINCITVAPNNKLVASGSHDKTAKLWNIDSSGHALNLLSVLRGHKRGIWDIHFSPVDQVVATSSGDGYIKMWSTADFSCVRTFEGHDSSVLSFSFISNGRQIISSGTDGLLKLWVVKTSECVKTLDGHEAKIWTVAASTNEDFVLSGGADSTLIMWKDVTEEENAVKQDELQKQVIQEQVLSNLIADKKYVRALGLAISLNKPFRALSILKEVIKQPEGEKHLERLVSKLRLDQIESVLNFGVDWNTNSRNCQAAQLLLNAVLKNFLPQDLMKLSSIQSIVEGFQVYTERHLQRLDTLLIDSYFSDYTYKCMKSTAPQI